MKRKLTALILVSAMALSAGAFFAACDTEPEHKTHYDVNADGKCDVCDVDMEGHKHIFSKKWTTDAENHWHAATCAHDDEVADKEAHTFNAYGICTVCKEYDQTPVAPVEGVYHFEAEHAILEDNEAASNATMVIEVDKTEFTESGKTDGAKVSNVGYFGGNAQGQTITWKFNAATEMKGVKLTLRIASSDGEWSDKLIREIDLGAEGAPVLSVNDAKVSLEGKKLTGLDNLTQQDMENGVAYHNFCEIEITIDIKAGENTVVLSSGTKGCNVDKIMLTTDGVLEFSKTNNSQRPGSH